jgi:gliding motility-associated-like protein
MQFFLWMKSRPLLTVVCFGISLLCKVESVYGQTTCSTPSNVSGFGVDNDLRANTPASILGDSWFYSSANPGSGIGVIGTTAATATPALSSAQFGSLVQSSGSNGRNRTYVQRMSVPAYTVVNGNTLIDAFMARDNFSPDSTAFVGSNKNGDNPAVWTVGSTSVPNKNDIIDVAGHLRRNNTTGKLWMFAMLTKLGTSGDSYADIEFYQTIPVLNSSTGNFTNTGPASTGGHTAFRFSSTGTIISVGDIILCMNYNSGGGTGSIKVWCNINNLDGNGNGVAWFNSQPSRPFNFTGDFMSGTGGNGFGYAEITSRSGAPCLMFSVLNNVNTPAGDWGNLTGSNANYSSTIQAGQMVNMAFNLTDIGLDWANISGPCFNMFGSLMFKTRSSSSYSSELKDCSGPHMFGNLSEVNAYGGPDRTLTCSMSQITLNGTTTTSGATLTWSTPNGNIVSGAGTPNITVNQPGTYILTAQSPTMSTCLAMDTVFVTQNITTPNANAGSDKILTCSASSAILNGFSTTPGVIYTWTVLGSGNIQSGANSASPVVNAAGCYLLTVTDPANGCTSRDTACVTTDFSAPVIFGQSQVNVNCFGGCNGSINFNVNGGQPPYSFQWSNGSSSQNQSALCAGIYTVTVTGSNGCTGTQTFNISQPSAALAVSASVTRNVSCFGGNNGQITALPTGGTSPYSFMWSNGTTGNVANGLTSGMYTVTITDANGCTSLVSATVNQPASALNSVISAVQNVLCNGGATGSVDLTPSGGTAPYSYLWNNGANTQDLSGVVAGTYTVTVTDINGCTTLSSAVVSQPASAVSLSASMTQSVSCRGGNNGSATASASGGTGPYTYLWSNGTTAATATNLSAANYTVTVTDANGCSAARNVTVTQPAAALSGSISSQQPVSCFAGNNGTINLMVTGGTTPYFYLWSSGNSTQDLNNLPAGTYTVTVTDSRGCTTQLNTTITQPAAPLTVSPSSIQAVSCFGGNNGNINLNVTGGTAPYAYNWNTGNTAQNLSGLSAGTYIATVTDANGCVANSSVTVTQPSAPLGGSISVAQNVACNGGANGSLVMNPSNGTAPYTYNWNTGSTSQSVSGLSSGTYTVTVTDANGCTLIRSAIVSQPAFALSPVINSTTSVSCFGGSNGSIDLGISGGTAPYSYLWNTGVTTQDITNLSNGTYTVSVTDANGCTSTLIANISQPVSALSSSISSSGFVACFNNNNGSITLDVNGGTMPYSYNWSNGANTQNLTGLSAGNYFVTVTDANGCTHVNGQLITQPAAPLSASSFVSSQVSCFGGSNGAATITATGGTSPYSYLWSNGNMTDSQSNLPAGNYTVTVTDANGCTTVRNITITQPSAALSATATPTRMVSCFGGSNGQISLSAIGGTSPYSFNWSNGATTQAITGLSAGTYSVTITDANGCTTQSSATITQPAQSLSGNITSTSSISCFSGSNGSIDLTVNGGTSPYTFMWNTGSTTEDISNLPAGSYSVTITDANGCTAQTTGSISQPAGSLGAGLNVSQNVACYGGGNGAFDLTVNGGTAPYTYNWSNGETTEDISGLSVGTYTVTITDNNGCIATATGSITQPSAALSGSVNSAMPVSCFGGSNGSIDLNVVGGTAPYSYNWSNGATSQDITNLSGGTYTVTITDINGCTNTVSATITQPFPALTASVQSSGNVSCFGGNNGTISINISGGTLPYTFNWSNGSNAQNQTGLVEGNYSVLVVDGNGCNTTVSANISQPSAPLSVSVNSAQSIMCTGDSTGSISIVTTGGTSPYSYLWSNGSVSPGLANVSAGNYSATITDANGCTGNVSVSLSQPPAPLSTSINSSQNVLCFGGSNGTVDLNVSGGSVPYSFQWSNGAVTEDLSGVPAGSYTVSITDANGCTSQQSATITEPSNPLAVSITNTTNVNCFGGSNGSIDLTASGGTAPYSYNWSNGETTEDLNNLVVGSYTVVITDVNGCTRGITAVVSEPGILIATIDSVQNVSCYGGSNGSAYFDVTGGTTPYFYSWSNGDVTPFADTLTAGLYNVTVTDANGCTITSTVNINQPSAQLAVQLTSVVHASCFGNDDGNIDILVQGGTPPYQYQWSNGSNSEDLFNLTAGTYTVTISDGNGCAQNLTAVVGQPVSPLSTNIAIVQQVACFGGETGAIDLTVFGGTAPYTYTWNNGETTEDLSNLLAGTYVVEVLDSNGCEAIASAVITQPASPLLATSTVMANVLCYGGSDGFIDLTAFGGTFPYTYIWSTGDTIEDISSLSAGLYSVTITDANGCTTQSSATVVQPAQQLNAQMNLQNVLCFNGNNGGISLNVSGGTSPYSFNWSTGATTQDIGGLIAGSYTVTVTDANGCDTVLTGNLIQPNAPLIPVLSVVNNVSCFGGNDGNLSATVSGGTPPYAYSWNTGATTSSIATLSAGHYTLTVTDANGCNAIISEFITQPVSPLSASVAVQQNVSCFNGSDGILQVTPTGGTAPYTILWNTGDTAATIGSLPTGTYTVTVTDTMGCTFQGSANVGQPNAPLNISGSTSIANCLYGIGGSVAVSVSGGTSPYSYLWSNNNTSSALTNVMPGTYTVTVTDANGCTIEDTYVVENDSELELHPGPTVICSGDFTTLWVDSIPNATYQWYFNGNILNGINSASFTTPTAGYYYAVVITPCGTFSTDSIEVQVKSIDNATISGNQIICPPQTVQLHATGGLTYLWSPTSFMSNPHSPNPIVAPITTTTYTVEITNEWNCRTNLSVTVAVACDTLFIPNGFSPNSDGVNDGFVIDNIDKYPGNKLWVYNRWGNLVYKAKDYDNKWDGVSNVSGIHMGRKLPSGTYYFIVDLNNNSKPHSGYLIIRR